MIERRTNKRRIWGAALAAIVMGLLLASCGSDDAGSSVSFVAPAEGATVAGGVSVEMAAEGITIEEAGEARDGAGHFHVIADAGCTTKGEAIGKDADHLHFGKGQAEGVIYLEPGEHELCLDVGDGVHEALGVSTTRTVQVAISDQDEWCGVVKEVDDLFEVTDNSSDDFATKQVGYESIRRLTTQLEDGLEVIDATPEDRVDEAIGFARTIAEVFVNTTDPGTLDEQMQPLFEEQSLEENAPGAAWILAACDIDIDG